MKISRSKRISVALFAALTPMMFAFQNCSPSTLSTTASTQAGSTNNGQSSSDTGGNTPETGGTITSPIAGSRSAYAKIEAESFDSQFGFQVVPSALGYANIGDYAVYNNIDFGSTGAKSIQISLGVSTTVAGRKFEIHLGSATGELIAEVTVQNTGGYSTFQNQAVNLNRTVTGLQTIVLLMKGDDLANIDGFLFLTSVASTLPPVVVVPPVTGGSTTNSVQLIIDDIKLPNSYPIAELNGSGQVVERQGSGYPARHSAIAMGNLAHGQSAPSFWSPSAGYGHFSTSNWPSLVPWVVVLTGTGNQASNTRIEFRNFRAYTLSKSTKRWTQVSQNSGIGGFNCPPGRWDNCGGTTDIYTTNGVTSLKPSGTGSNFHGWSTSGGRIENPFDVEIYYATIESRLVGTDTGQAQYMFHVGTDFYPEGANVNQMSGFNPGSGYSRTKAVTTEWQPFNYATIDVGLPASDQFGNHYVLNRAYIAPQQVLIQYPPPL